MPVQTSRVAPRIEALIIRRHTKPGESVGPDQSLVTVVVGGLFSSTLLTQFVIPVL